MKIHFATSGPDGWREFDAEVTPEQMAAYCALPPNYPDRIGWWRTLLNDPAFGQTRALIWQPAA